MTSPSPGLDRQRVRSAFDRAADSYDDHAVLQHEVGRRLLERTEFLRAAPAVVLDLGCGTGFTTRSLSAAFPKTQLIGLDWAKSMLGKLQRGLIPVCADMQRIPIASRRVDLIFSNLAIQWSPDLPLLFRELRRVLRPGGLLLFSTMGPDTLHELRTAWSEVDDLPHVNSFADLHDIGDLLVAEGFNEPVMDMDLFTLEYPDVLAIMRELKAIGAHNASVERRAGLTGKQRLERVVAAYEQFRQGERYPSTWEVYYGAAFGPPDGQPIRTPVGEVAEFSIDSLRGSRRKGRT